MENLLWYIQTDQNRPIGKIIHATQDDHSNDANWIPILVPKYQHDAFANRYSECGYDYKKLVWVSPTDFSADAAIPADGEGIIQQMNDKMNVLWNDDPHHLVTLHLDPHIYGVMWNRGAGNTLGNGMTRIDDAKGMSSTLHNGINDFDNAGPFQGEIVSDQYGNLFKRIPKMYFKKTKTGSEDNGTITWEVSLRPFPGSYLPACFKEFDSNHNEIGELPYVDVGCYDASLNGNKLQSVSGQAPLVNTGIDAFRQYARNNGAGYQLLDVHVWDMLRTLFVIEFATLKSDSVFVGVRDGNSHLNSGTTDSLPGSTGAAKDGSFKYRGIENMYANVFQWLDGLNFDLQTGHQLYVCDDANAYASQCYTKPYEHVGYTWAWDNAKDEGLDPNHPEVNLNENGDNGDNHTYYCDWQGGWTGYAVPDVGNPWSGSDGGLFGVDAGTPSTEWAAGGCRLVKKASV